MLPARPLPCGSLSLCTACPTAQGSPLGKPPGYAPRTAQQHFLLSNPGYNAEAWHPPLPALTCQCLARWAVSSCPSAKGPILQVHQSTGSVSQLCHPPVSASSRSSGQMSLLPGDSEQGRTRAAFLSQWDASEVPKQAGAGRAVRPRREASSRTAAGWPWLGRTLGPLRTAGLPSALTSQWREILVASWKRPGTLNPHPRLCNFG